ncbi:MFS transporter [Nocardioides acrostichi]|uniref:Multidrug efflux pump Tap n=1 Tax=Nocardioides acrostichi TaxID=2784339 RepID=A0A930UXE6_9ACTN|nr:MFS transporter [Nocardioides acrostichi]MBF4162648.1 MFS transporter [Nocardioides acrostichi]
MTTAAAPLRRHHDFRLLWVGQTLSELGTHVSSFVFPLVTYALTGSTFLAGCVGAAHLLGLVASLLPAGVLSDRVDGRLLMRSASALGALGYASLGLAAWWGHLTLTHLLVVALAGGVAAGIFMPTETVAVRRVVERDQLPAALSLNAGRQYAASIVGGPLGGALYGLARWLPFAADAVSYAVSWLLLGRLRADLRPESTGEPRASIRRELRTGLGYVAAHPLFRTLAGWAFLANLSMNALFTVAVLRLVADGVDPLHLGLVETAAGVAGVLGAIVAPWLIERLPTGWLTIAVAWSPLPLALPMAWWGHPLVVALGLGLVSVLNPAGNAGMTSYRLTVTPDELVGRVQSSTQFVAMCSLPLAPVTAGTLLALLGGQGAMLAAGLLCAVTALVPTLSRGVRRVPRPVVWREAVASREVDDGRVLTPST